MWVVCKIMAKHIIHISLFCGQLITCRQIHMASSRAFLINTAQYFRPKPPSLKIGEEISRGAYGSVHCGKLDGTPVAVKRIHRLLLEAAKAQGDFEQVGRLYFVDRPRGRGPIQKIGTRVSEKHHQHKLQRVKTILGTSRSRMQQPNAGSTRARSG